MEYLPNLQLLTLPRPVSLEFMCTGVTVTSKIYRIDGEKVFISLKYCERTIFEV